MVQGYSTSHCPGTGRRTTGGARTGKGSFSFRPIHGNCLVIPSGEIHDRYSNAHTATELKLRRFEEPGREAEGAMLNITGMNRFYYLRNFHDMRCKYERGEMIWILLAGPTVSSPWLIWRNFSMRWSKAAGIMRTCYRWLSELILTNFKNQVRFLKTLSGKLPREVFPMGYVKIGRLHLSYEGLKKLVSKLEGVCWILPIISTYRQWHLRPGLFEDIFPWGGQRTQRLWESTVNDYWN